MKHAFRQLAKSPGFTATVVLTLTLGIGSAAIVFTALDAILLRPLPFIQHEERMLYLNEAMPEKGVDGTDISLADFLRWRERTKTLSALWLYEDRTAIITGRSTPLRKLACGTNAGAFEAMGVAPILGRTFRAEDDRFGAPAVAVLGYGLWQSEFSGAPDVLGQTIPIDGKPTTIIGVMPKGWRYPERADLWLPLAPDPADARHGYFRFSGHAMLRPGVTLDEARAEFAGISAALAKEFPTSNQGLVAVLRPVREEAAQDAAQLTWLLFGAVLFVFLIACANVANLLLARASARTREMAIRLALGASRRQVIGQLLRESVLLALCGGIGGVLFAFWGVDVMLSTIPIELPFWVRFQLDPRVLAFVTALSLLASMLFGFMPAWQASRPDLIDDIKEAGRSTTGSVRSHRLRNTLVVIEIALALVLLVGAGLMMRSFVALHQAPPGFDARGVLTFRIGLPATMTEDKNVTRRFFAELTSRLNALPGVESAGAVSRLPGLGFGGYNDIRLEGEPAPRTQREIRSALARVSGPHFFDTLHIPLKTGRLFHEHDDAEHPRVAIVDEIFVQRFLAGKNPLGQRFARITKDPGNTDWIEIVGVVGATRRFFDRDETAGCFFLPHAQNPTDFMSFALRVRGNPASHIAAARATVLALDPDLPIFEEKPLQMAIDQSDTVWIRKFFGALFSAFALVALLLSAIGIYGVIAYSVAQRTHEIGVRMALGAQPLDVLALIIRQGSRLIMLGLGLGFVAAYFVTRLLAGNLYGISVHDPLTFAGVALVLASVALLASYIPGRSATKVDPMVALRTE